jgi:hypothetical protein
MNTNALEAALGEIRRLGHYSENSMPEYRSFVNVEFTLRGSNFPVNLHDGIEHGSLK